MASCNVLMASASSQVQCPEVTDHLTKENSSDPGSSICTLALAIPIQMRRDAQSTARDAQKLYPHRTPKK